MRQSPMRRALAPLALACLLAVAGCSSSGGRTPTAGSPGSDAGSIPAGTPATSQDPAASSPATAGSPTADSGSSSSPAVHTYQHLTLTLPVTDASVPDAPPGLTAYLRTLLTKDWTSLGHTRECQKSGTVVLQATRADGFAYGSHEINVTPSGGCMEAATMGGGYRALWKSIDGTWKQILAMQDVPNCSTFAKWDVPSDLLGKDAQCYNGSSVVAYHHD